MILNPEYENAEYELGFREFQYGTLLIDPHPHRFNVLPPDDVFEDGDKPWKWVKEHSIPKFIASP